MLFQQPLYGAARGLGRRVALVLPRGDGALVRADHLSELGLRFAQRFAGGSDIKWLAHSRTMDFL